jgi:hypothetical protein
MLTGLFDCVRGDAQLLLVASTSDCVKDCFDVVVAFGRFVTTTSSMLAVMLRRRAEISGAINFRLEKVIIPKGVRERDIGRRRRANSLWVFFLHAAA